MKIKEIAINESLLREIRNAIYDGIENEWLNKAIDELAIEMMANNEITYSRAMVIIAMELTDGTYDHVLVSRTRTAFYIGTSTDVIIHETDYNYPWLCRYTNGKLIEDEDLEEFLMNSSVFGKIDWRETK